MNVGRTVWSLGQRVRGHASLPVIWASRVIAFLFGIGIGLALVGYTRMIQSIFGPAPMMSLCVVAVVLVCAACGPWAARRAAMSLVGLWAQTMRGAFRSEASRPSLRGGSDVQSLGGLAWLLHSMLAAVVGVLLLAGLACSAGVRYAWGPLSTVFFWTPATEALCIVVLIFAVVGPGAMTAGLQFASLYSAVSRSRFASPGTEEKEARITASLLAGVALGLAAYGRTGVSAERWVMLAAIPMFAISAVSVLIARWVERCSSPASSLSERQAEMPAANGGPEWAPDGEPRGLVLTAVAAWGAATGLWCCALWSLGRASDGGSASSQACWTIAAMATGAWIAGWPRRRRRYSMGGYGVALWGAGAAIMLSIALSPNGGGREWLLSGLSLTHVITAVCLGYALPYGRRAFVGRAHSERQGLAQWAAATFCGLTTGALAHDWFTMTAGSDIVAMTAGCLLLLIFGGLLSIHEHTAAARVRRQRVGVVFASLALAVLVLPSAAKRPAQWASTPAKAKAAAARLPDESQSTRGLRRGWAEALDADLGWVRPGAQIASIGDTVFLAPRGVWRIDHVLWRARAGTDAEAAPPDRAEPLSGPPKVYQDADAWWRRGRSQYDFIVQYADGLSAADVPARLSWEWFDGLRRRLLPRGTLLVELPLGRLNRAGADSALQTFAVVFESYDPRLVVVETEGALSAYLLASGVMNPAANEQSVMGRALSNGSWTSMCRLTPLVDGRRRVPLNTVRTPAFSANSKGRDWGTGTLRWMLAVSIDSSSTLKEQ